MKSNYGELSVAIYCPPKNNLKKENFQEFFEMLGSKFTAESDFSSKHILWEFRNSHNITITIRAKELKRLVEEKNYSVLSHNFTYWPTNPKKNLLDFFIIKDIPTRYLSYM